MGMQNSSSYRELSLDDIEIYEFEKIGVPTFVYLAILCVIGITGNLLVLIVYLPAKVNVHKTFVLCLAIVDFVACAFSVPSKMYDIKHHYTLQWPALCKVSKAVHYYVALCSLTLLGVVAIERYRKVCQATRAQFTVRTAKIACAVVIVFVFTVTVIPVSIMYGVNKEHIHYHSLVVYECTVLQEYKQSTAVKIYRGITFFIVIILLLICIILYYMMGRIIYKHKKRLQKSKKDKTLLKICFFRCRKRDDQSSQDPSGQDSTPEEELSHLSHNNLPDNSDQKNVTSTTQSNTSDISVQPEAEELGDTIHSDINASTRKKISRSRDITVMFLIVSLISFGGYLPYLVLTLIRNIDWQLYMDFESNNAALELFFGSMLYLNNAINPLVYGFMDKRFQRDLLSVYKKAKTKITTSRLAR